MRIICTGAQGTGKTTLMNNLASREEFKNFTKIDSISRSIQKDENVDLGGGTNTTSSYQSKIFDKYYQALSQDNIISDRSLVDVCAYTDNLDKSNIDNIIELLRELKQCIKYEEEYKDNTLYVYLPIEFEVSDDGVRCVDEEYQRSVDSSIKYFLHMTDIPVLRVTGSVEERTQQVIDYLI